MSIKHIINREIKIFITISKWIFSIIINALIENLLIFERVVFFEAHRLGTCCFIIHFLYIFYNQLQRWEEVSLSSFKVFIKLLFAMLTKLSLLSTTFNILFDIFKGIFFFLILFIENISAGMLRKLINVYRVSRTVLREVERG